MLKNFIRCFYLFFGVLDLVALVAALYLSFDVIVFYFSYFTVLSNILITALFLYLGIVSPKKISKDISWLYGAGVLYMTITGIIYWSILVNAKSLALDPWINLTLHGAMPVTAFLSWVMNPPREKLLFKNSAEWLIFPVIFVFYTLVHGPFVNWYPYPFLSPIASGSYFQVFVNVCVILFGAWITGLILIKISNTLK